MQPPHRVPAFQKASDKFPWPHVLSKWNPQHHNFSCCFLFGKFPVHLPQSVWDTLTPDDFPVRLLQSRRHTHPSDRDLLKNIQNFSHTMDSDADLPQAQARYPPAAVRTLLPQYFQIHTKASYQMHRQSTSLSAMRFHQSLPDHLYKKSI